MHRALCAPSARATRNSESAAPTRSHPIPPQGNSGRRRAISAGHRTIPRRLVAACTVGVLALCASLYVAPAWAQVSSCVSPCETFISNTGVTEAGVATLGTGAPPTVIPNAQSFRTGDNSEGYTLDSVVVVFTVLNTRTNLMVQVREDAAGDPAPDDDTGNITLMPPSLTSNVLGSTELEFTAPSNITLSSNTTYHLVLSITGTPRTTSVVTSTRGSLDAGTASDWSFPQGFQSNPTGGSWEDASTSDNIQMQVRGTAIPDTTAPTLGTAAVNGDTLTLTYDEALDGGSEPAATTFMLGGTSVSVNTVAVSGMTVTLTLSATVSSEATVTVSYTAPTATGTNPLQDVAGNPAADFMDQTVTNTTPDNTPPMLTGAAVNGDTLTLTYDETLDTASMPAATTFTVRVGSTPQTVSTVAISGSVVTLTLSGAVTSGDSVTLTYAVPGSNPVQDAAGNDAAALTTQAVTNNTPPMLLRGMRTGMRRPIVGGNELSLPYDDALDESSVPAASAFMLGGTTPTVSAVAIDDMDVVLTLSAPVSSTDVVTVTYMPGTNPLQNAAGD